MISTDLARTSVNPSPCNRAVRPSPHFLPRWLKQRNHNALPGVVSTPIRQNHGPTLKVVGFIAFNTCLEDSLFSPAVRLRIGCSCWIGLVATVVDVDGFQPAGSKYEEPLMSTILDISLRGSMFRFGPWAVVEPVVDRVGGLCRPWIGFRGLWGGCFRSWERLLKAGFASLNTEDCRKSFLFGRITGGPRKCDYLGYCLPRRLLACIPGLSCMCPPWFRLEIRRSVKLKWKVKA